jgi:NAD(P)H-quinone oxidoreductase subunit 4
MLSALIWLPIVGALIVGFWRSDTYEPVAEVSGEVAAGSEPGVATPKMSLSPGKSGLKTAALVLASVLLGITFVLLYQFDLSNPGMQLSEYHNWIEPIGISYSLGVDGLSLPLLVLNALLTWIVILSSNRSQGRSRLFYALVFLVNAGVAGAFLAQNLLLFVLFYELELIPLYLMIAIWGSERREFAATKFLLYTAVSGILILIGFLALGWLTTSPDISFDFADINPSNLPLALQIPLLLTLIVGFGIKTPLVPFHTWLPDTYVESSPSTTILLGGILAKLGAYGLFRFCFQLFPQAWEVLAPWLALWAAIGVLYGALAAIAQKDIKRMVAYSSIGHMSYILLACAAATELSLVGGVAQMVSHGIILAILFYLVGIVEAKVGTRDLDVLNGLLNPVRGLPLTSALLILGGMASAGIPGLVGFVAEFLVFQGSFAKFPIPTIISIVGTGLTAVYFIILLNRTCFGRLDNSTAYYPRVTLFEQAPALILAVLIVFLGVAPTWLVRWSEPTTKALVAAMPHVDHAQVQVATSIDHNSGIIPGANPVKAPLIK